MLGQKTFMLFQDTSLFIINFVDYTLPLYFILNTVNLLSSSSSEAEHLCVW